MTEDLFIVGVFDREGREYAEPPKIDQPTGCGGITLPVLSAWLKRQATIADLKALTVETATPIIRANIRAELSAHGFDKVPYEPLRWQLLDYAWNSGPGTAVKWFQRTIGVPEPQVDGVIGPSTLSLLARLSAWMWPIVNNALAGERAHAAYHGKMDPKFSAGVAHRAIEFVLPLDAPLPLVAV